MPIIQNLIADQFGSHIGKYQGRLKVTQQKETLAQAPLLHLESVTIASKGVSISADAIAACTEHGIPIHFLSSSGTPYAALYSAGLTGTVLTRRAQLAAYADGRGVKLALAFAGGKIENQAALLKYSSKYRKETDPALHKELHWLAGEVIDHMEELCTLDFVALREGYCVDEVREHLLSCEGRAAKLYWRGFGLLLGSGHWPAALLFALLYGVGNGMLTIVKGTAIAQYVSREHVASLNGALGVPLALTRAAAPLVMGLLWQPGVGYQYGLWLLLVMSVVAIAMLLLAQRRVLATGAGEIREVLAFDWDRA